MWKRICHVFHPTWRQIQGSHFAFQHLHKVNVGILKHTDIPEAGLVAVSKTGQHITSRHTKTAKTHDESAKKLCNMYSYLQLFWFVMWKLWNWTKIWNILESPKEVIKKPRINLLMPLSPYRFFFLIVLQAICTYHNQRGLCTCGRHPKNHSFSFHWPRAFIPLLQKRFLEQTHRSHM